MLPSIDFLEACALLAFACILSDVLCALFLLALGSSVFVVTVSTAGLSPSTVKGAGGGGGGAGGGVEFDPPIHIL